LSDFSLLVVSAFLIGATSLYLFYNSDGIRNNSISPYNAQSSRPSGVYDAILPLLKPEEKDAVSARGKRQHAAEQAHIKAWLVKGKGHKAALRP
jgi:hypothetical protein